MAKKARPTRRTPRRRRPRYHSLADYLARSGETQVVLARHLRISQAHISRIATGVATPRPDLAFRIATYCDLPLESFATVYFARRAVRDVA